MKCEVSGETRSLFDRIGGCFDEEPREECKDIADNNLEFVGRGQNRFVYKVPDKDCVVKFALDPNSTPASNALEVEVDQDLPDDIDEWFADVHDYDEKRSWLTMEKLDIPELNDRDGEWNEILKNMGEFKDDLESVGWRCNDDRPTNWGQNDDGDWIFFDFPYCFDESEISTE